MKRSTFIAPRGVALVITLIMLSVVTIVAVAFLAVARRERASMGLAEDQTDTRYLTEVALARAQADIASRMAATGSRVVPGPFSSTNYVSGIGFDPSLGATVPYLDYGVNATNVGYTNVNGVRLGFDNDDPQSREQYRAMLANLLYDPRPPVFITTNAVSREQDFRFYLDLNRNGQFDPPLTESKSLGVVDGRESFFPSRTPGDPQWLGVLEYPNMPHSATNRFIGRVAYLVLPTGLDFNYIHNRANETGGNSYLRNQGLGSWELNLAALLERVDRGVWSNYNYRAEVGGNSGNSFFDAQAVVQYRLNNQEQDSADKFLEPGTFHPNSPVDLPFKKTFLDLYANGPIVRALALPPTQNNSDNLRRPWDGADRFRYFQNLEDLFSVSSGFSNRLRGAVARPSSNGTNDWTLYRLLSEIGTDSPDGRFYTAYDATKGYYRRAKMNLNFAHGDDGDLQKSTSGKIEPEKAGTFRSWDPVEFFTNAVDRLLEVGLHYQGVTFHSDRIPVQYFGVTVVTNNPPGVQSRLSYVTNVIRYGPDIHRLLQLAANLHESAMVRTDLPAGVREMPTVFRPRFGFQVERFNLDNSTYVMATNLYIMGWAQVTNASPMTNRWIDPVPGNIAALMRTMATNAIPATNPKFEPLTDVNVYGVPWVVGARKGYPSFNEAYWQTEIAVTRRVRLAKRTPTTRYATNGAGPIDGQFTTNVQYLLDVSRRGSVEAWNSYQSNYTRGYSLIATNIFCLGFSNYNGTEYKSLVQDTPLNSRSLLRYTNSNVLRTNSWPGSKTLGGSPQSFQVPIDYASIGRGLTNQLVFVPGRNLQEAGLLVDLNIPENRRLGFGTRFSDAHSPFATPNLTVAMTNYLIYAMIDEGTGRVIDFVNLKSVTVQTNVLNWMGLRNTNDTYTASPLRVGNEIVRDFHLWLTNVVIPNYPGITAGITNQILASTLRPENVSLDVYRSIDNWVDDKRKAVANFRYFMYRDAVEAEWKAYGDPNIRTNLTMDAIAPTRKFIITDRRAVNDPLVHYTLEDLRPGALWLVDKQGGAGSVSGLNTNNMGIALRRDMVQRQPRSFAPWGLAPIYTGASDLSAYGEDVRFKDPGIGRSDHWNFPQQEMPTVGWIGRVHRGTPWQTVYLKSGKPPLGGSTIVMPSEDSTWATWSGYRANESINYGLYFRGRPGPWSTNLNATTLPQDDWNLLHVFTTAYNDNAARGLLPSDHPGEAGWAAVLGGVNVVTGPNGANTFIDPTTPQFRSIVTNLQYSLGNVAWGKYTNLGEVLSAPSLSVQSPYLTGWEANVTVDSDALVERIPQQVLGLLRQPEPHFVIYAFGQSLKPAPGSLVTSPGPYFGLCQNYQITGEQIIKSVVRFDGPATNLQAIVERQQILPAP